MNRIAQKTSALLLCTGLLSGTLHAQAMAYQWMKQFGGVGDEDARAVVQDMGGNSYVTGSFMGTVDFDPGPGTLNLTAAAGSDPFVVKLDPMGNLVWARQFSGSDNEAGTAIALDPWGNVLTAGTYKGTTDFDPGPGTLNLTNPGTFSAYVAKLTPAGNLIWARGITGTLEQQPNALAADTAGGVLTVGSFTGTTDFDPGAGLQNKTSAGSGDIFVQRLDSAGAFTWVTAIGAAGQDAAHSIHVNTDGSSYVCGEFRLAPDFDPGPGSLALTSAGGADAFMVYLKSNGGLNDAYRIGGTADDVATSLRVAPLSSSIYLAGYFGTNVDFDPGPGTTTLFATSTSDGFVARFSMGLALQWAIPFNGSGPSTTQVATEDALGFVHAVGRFAGTLDTDPGSGIANLNSAGGNDVYYTLLDNSGNFYWSGRLGGTGSETVYDLEVNLASEATLVGNFVSPQVDFDMGYNVAQATNGGSGDGYVLRMFQCFQAIGILIDTACTSYTLHGHTYTASGLYIDTLASVTNCDSLLLILLEIYPPTNTVLTQTACDSFTLNTTTYTSSGTYTQLLTNGFGCDSMLTLNLTIIPSVTATLNVTDCDLYQLNGQTYTATGTYTQSFTSSQGCDSTLVLNLTLSHSSTGVVNVTDCGAVSVNGQTYTSSGVYTQQLTNAAGCDSTLTILATVNPFPGTGVSQAGNILTAATGGATYQWLDCDNGFAVIPGATGQSFTPTATGNYAVQVTLNGCSATSTCTQVTVVGMGDALNVPLTVYPNPAGVDGFFVDLRALDARVYSVTLVNALGQTMGNWALDGQQIHSVGTEGLARGVYSLRVAAEGQRWAVAVVVE